MIAFHEDPRAFAILTPPPIFVQIHRRDWRSMRDATIDFTLWFGPLPSHWIAQHEAGPTPTSFVDRMVQGPLAIWVHTHTFTNVPGGVELHDSIRYQHRSGGFWGLFSRAFFDGLPLRIFFVYRHLRTRLSVKRYPARAAVEN